MSIVFFQEMFTSFYVQFRYLPLSNHFETWVDYEHLLITSLMYLEKKLNFFKECLRSYQIF